jgi:hypothetical protein
VPLPDVPLKQGFAFTVPSHIARRSRNTGNLCSTIPFVHSISASSQLPCRFHSRVVMDLTNGLDREWVPLQVLEPDGGFESGGMRERAVEIVDLLANSE